MRKKDKLYTIKQPINLYDEGGDTENNEESTEDDDEDMFSIIREYPSLTAALEDIPLQERAIATSRIASGELEIVCR